MYQQSAPLSHLLDFPPPFLYHLAYALHLTCPKQKPEPLTQIRNLALKRIIRRINPRLYLVQPSSDVDVLIEDRACGLFVVLFEAAGAVESGRGEANCGKVR